MSASSSAAPSIAHTLLCVSDIQARFRSIIHGGEAMISAGTYLCKLWTTLEGPVLVTEQYPKAFGATVEEIASAAAPALTHTRGKGLKEEKTQFSMLSPTVLDFIKENSINSIVLCGLETHICVLQTARDALAHGLRVYVIVDAVSSQRAFDRSVALERLSRMGAHLSTCESITFELLGDAKHPSFKTVAALNKERTEAVAAGGAAALLSSM